MEDKKILKISRLDEKEAKDIKQSLHMNGASINSWGEMESNQENQRASKRLGICGKCRHLIYVEGEFGSVYARCGGNDQRLRGNEKVKECTMFNDVSYMELDTALNLAWIINDDKKERIGF